MGSKFTEPEWRDLHGPHFSDACEHGEGTYVGSCELVEDAHYGTGVFDVYVYEEATSNRFSSCVRYGNDTGKYLPSMASWDVGYRVYGDGPVQQMLANALRARGITPVVIPDSMIQE